jgi:hypothetical protein
MSVEPSPLPDSTSDPTVTRRFYASRPYGSESQFNPFSLIVNGGYDQQRTSDKRHIFALPYEAEFRTVWRSVTNPEPVLRHYGWRNWLTHEVFPLSTKGSGGGIVTQAIICTLGGATTPDGSFSNNMAYRHPEIMLADGTHGIDS